MVLSNKKLKQKLRAEKGGVLVTSEAQVRDSGINVSHPEAPNSNSTQSLKPVDSASQDSSLSKRRKKAPQENGGGDAAKKEGPVKVVESKQNKRKREEEERIRALEERRLLKRQKRESRRKEEIGAGDAMVEKAEDGADNAPEHGNVKKTTKSKKKKIIKKKKGKKNVDDVNGEQGLLSVGTAEVASQNAVMESINNTSISEVSADLSTKVCVGGIPYYSTEDDIRSFFESCGTIVDIDCMTFPDSGRFRGIAIVNFKTEAAAKRALALDGSDMGGLFLKIQPYMPTRTVKATKFSPMVVVEGYYRIYAGNLSYDITEEDLRKLFSECTITSIRFGEDKETKEFRGYAHIDFSDNASLNLALTLDQRVVCGRPVRISRAVPPKGPITASTTVPPTHPIPTSTTVNVVRSGTEEKKAAAPSASNAVVLSAAEVVPATVSGKIRRRTCYECGDRGHLSSDCPKKQAEEQANAAAEAVQRSVSEEKKAGVPSVVVPSAAKVVPSAPKVAPSAAEVTPALSGKIRRRTCYECGDRGHLSSACPKKLAEEQANAAAEVVQRSGIEEKNADVPSVADAVVHSAAKVVPSAPKVVPSVAEVTPALSGKIRRRTCYECGERGHLSSACPKKLAEEQANAAAS